MHLALFPGSLPASYTTEEPGKSLGTRLLSITLQVCAIILLLVSWSRRGKVKAGLFSKHKLLVMLKEDNRYRAESSSSLIIF